MVALLMVGLLLAGLPSPALAGPVRGGLDYFRTFPNSGHSFSQDPIPADFFDPGSAPFVGGFFMTGVPLDPGGTGSADIIVRRVETARFSHPFPSSDTVPIEIVALSLRSTSPITVTYLTWTEMWDVTVTLPPGAQPQGSMSLTHVTNDFGTWDAILPVLARYTFTRRGDGAVRTLDASIGNLTAQNVRWEHRVPKTIVASNRFCPSCQDGVGQPFIYASSTGTQLNLESAFP